MRDVPQLRSEAGSEADCNGNRDCHRDCNRNGNRNRHRYSYSYRHSDAGRHRLVNRRYGRGRPSPRAVSALWHG